jgi:hypothetical protein
VTKRNVRLPKHEFYYTIDQVTTLLQISEHYLTSRLLFYLGREAGARPKDKILAVNIAPDGEDPVWRIPEKSLKAYLRYKGIRSSDRGYV